MSAWIAVFVSLLTLFLSTVLPDSGVGPIGREKTPLNANFSQAASGSSANALQNKYNILILGSDERVSLRTADGGIWRTDTIIILSIDYSNRKAALLSIPRDLYVDIPGFEKNRINTADYLGETYRYPGGGPGLVNATLKNALGIETQAYVRISMAQFKRLVDVLGGVDVWLDEPFYDFTPDFEAPGGWDTFTLPAGKNHLDGASAVKYARYRYNSSDLDRSARQQKLLVAIKNRMLELQWLPRIGEMWGVYRDMIETDLGFFDALRLAEFGSRLDSKDIYGHAFDYSLVYPYTTPGGAQVLVLKSREAFDEWASTLFEGKSLAGGGEGISPSAGGADGVTLGPPAPPWAYGSND